MIDCNLPFSTYNSTYKTIHIPTNIETGPTTTINHIVPSIATIIPARSACVDNFPVKKSILIQAIPPNTSRARRIASTTNPNNVAKIKHTLANLLTKTLRSEEHTSELQSRFDLVCRLLLEKKKT